MIKCYEIDEFRSIKCEADEVGGIVIKVNTD